MKRILNVIILLSSLSLLTFLIFIFINKLYLFNFFPFIVLSFMFLLFAGVVKTFLLYNELHKLIRWVVVFLCVLPLIVPLVGLIDSYNIEKNWPLMFAGIIFQVGIGLLSVMGMFMMTNRPHFFTRWMFYIATIILAGWFVVILLKLPNSFVYTYAFVLGSLMTLFYILGIVNDVIRSKR
ncbi:MAG: hypothetical protein WEA99_00075 [Brumimicrobium sp.]